MRTGGFFRLFRMGFAALLRDLARIPVWFADLILVAADLADPVMPETIRRPREWLPRLWTRWHQPDANEPPR